MRVRGAILVGGRSSRMGRPKQDLPIRADGATMLDVVRDALEAATGAPALLVGGPALPDRAPGQGPLGGLDALLAHDAANRYLVCPCDMPYVTPELFEQLLRAEPLAAPLAVFHDRAEDRLRPFPMRIDATAAGAVARLLRSDRRRVRALFEEITPIASEALADGARLRSVNTPDDYEQARRGGSR